MKHRWIRRSLWCLIPAAVLAALAPVRNGQYEFCTTRAYGHPFPWYVDYCLCEKVSPSIHPMYWGLNLAALALAVVGVLWRTRKPPC